MDIEVCLGIPSCGTRWVPRGSRGLILGSTGRGHPLFYPTSVFPTILDNLNKDKVGIEEDAAAGLDAALEMEVGEDRRSKGEEEGVGTQRALGALEFITQEAGPSGTTLIDACNGFNELRRLAMLGTVRHCWTAGARYMFN